MSPEGNPENPQTTKGFYIREASLVGRLNISRTDLLAIRNRLLTEGQHYARVGRRVMLSDEGFALVAKSLEMTPAEAHKAAPAGDPKNEKKPAGAAYTHDVMVYKVSPRATFNPHIVLAVNLVGQLVRVRVKSKTNFRPGMPIKCMQVQGDLYDLVGNCPRFPGKY